jgi:hypothetical protein
MDNLLKILSIFSIENIDNIKINVFDLRLISSWLWAFQPRRMSGEQWKSGLESPDYRFLVFIIPLAVVFQPG